MRTICVLIEDTIDSYKVIKEIEKNFPCFSSYELKENGYVEVSILCRQEDAGAVEARLASLV